MTVSQDVIDFLFLGLLYRVFIATGIRAPITNLAPCQIRARSRLWHELKHLRDDAEHGERHDHVVRHARSLPDRPAASTFDAPGWRNWSDAPDLKSGALRACGFESRPRHLSDLPADPAELLRFGRPRPAVASTFFCRRCALHRCTAMRERPIVTIPADV